MAKESVLPFSVATVVADVLQQNGTRVRNINTPKAEEAALRRYEAAAWLRKKVGFVLSKDLPEEPSEEEFRLGLRSGIILCSALNKLLPGSVPKVVEKPSVCLDGTALPNNFENVRNFLHALQEMGIPTFDPSDFEQGGKSKKIVKCVLALKSYCEWKQGGGNISLWKYGGTSKSSSPGNSVVRRNSELSTSSISRSQSEKSLDDSDDSDIDDLQDDPTEMPAQSLNVLLRAVLSDKKPEEVPLLMESMLRKVMEEVERRLASHQQLIKTESVGLAVSDDNKPLPGTVSGESTLNEEEDNANDTEMKEENANDSGMKEEENESTTEKKEEENENEPEIEEEEVYTIEIKQQEQVHNTVIKQDEEVHTTEIKKDEDEEDTAEVKKEAEESLNRKIEEQLRQKLIEESKPRLLKQQQLLDQHQRDIQELRHTLQTTKVGMQSIQTKYHEEFQDLGNHLSVLTHAASRYRKVLDENRKLYNQVQDLKGSIRVYCRVRPFLPERPSRSSIVDHIDEGSIEIITPSKYGKEGRKSFSFNKVFGPSATQEEVFLDTRPLIRSVLDGFNVCIFAYGQTGSGKTHTMTGPPELTEETQGVNFRALNDLFNISEQRKGTFQYEVSVQMMEIYNEQVRDLLASDGLNKKLEIHNSSHGLNVPDANLVPVTSTSDVIELMDVGQKNRAVCTTALNDRSSRSHSCLTVHVQGKDLTSGAVLRGCMHLVDLAGSERVNKSEVTGDRLKEAVHINKSLSALGDVIASLAQKNSHVPYRNSKLTQLLQDSLGGHAKTLMFVHISPELDAVGETLSTLTFAERVATVELGAAKSNTGSSDVRELKEQIASLKAALARKEGGESVNIPRSMSSSSITSLSSSPEVPPPTLTKPSGSLPLYSDIVKGGPITRKKQQVEHLGNVDIVDDNKMDEKDLSTKGWIEKVIVNKQDMVNGTNSPRENGDVENRKLPELFYQRHNSKIQQKQNNGVKGTKKNHNNEQKPQFETNSTYDSDGFDSAITSDSSEQDLHWQGSLLPKVSSVPTSLGSKLRKPSPKATRTQDQSAMHKSSSIPTLAAPSQARKNVAYPPLHKNGRQGPLDGKKRYGK